MGKDVYKIYEGYDFDNIVEVLSTLKNKTLKIGNILIEKYRDMIKNPDFEHDYWPKTATGIYKIGRDSIRLTKWLIYHDRSCSHNMNYFDLMGSISENLISNEIS